MCKVIYYTFPGLLCFKDDNEELTQTINPKKPSGIQNLSCKLYLQINICASVLFNNIEQFCNAMMLSLEWTKKLFDLPYVVL